MNITELIKKLEAVRAENGDIETITYDYAGGDYEERDPTVRVREPDQWNGLTEAVLVLNG